MAIAVLPGSPVLGSVDRLIHRGTNRPRPMWAFGGSKIDGAAIGDMNLAGSTMVLSVFWGGGGFEVTSTSNDPNAALYGGLTFLTRLDVGLTDGLPSDYPAPSNSLFRDVVRWEFTPAAALAMPLGRIARFRLDRQVRSEVDGEFRAYRDGHFIVRGID